VYEREEGFSMTILSALGAVLAVVCLAGIAAVSGWVMLALEHPIPAQATSQRCNICGVVEHVREVEQLAQGAGFSSGMGLGSTSSGGRPASVESLVVLLAAIGGASRGGLMAPPRTYEVSVRLRDGSVRVLRDSIAPPWKAGDQVKVIRGRIEAVS
jgi:hypothetical protein